MAGRVVVTGRVGAASRVRVPLAGRVEVASKGGVAGR